jgi:hypothetical protein
MLSLVWAYTKETFGAIAVETQKLEAIFRIAVFLQKSSYLLTTVANFFSVSTTTTVYVVDRQELWLRFAAAHAFTAVSFNDLKSCFSVRSTSSLSMSLLNAGAFTIIFVTPLEYTCFAIGLETVLNRIATVKFRMTLPLPTLVTPLRVLRHPWCV